MLLYNWNCFSKYILKPKNRFKILFFDDLKIFKILVWNEGNLMKVNQLPDF